MSNDLKTAVLALDTSDDTHWTRSGLPDCNHLKHVLKGPVTRSHVNGAVPGLTRNTIDKIRMEQATEPLQADVPPTKTRKTEQKIEAQADLAACNAWSRRVHAQVVLRK